MDLTEPANHQPGRFVRAISWASVVLTLLVPVAETELPSLGVTMA